MKYERYEFADGSAYKAEAGKDGLSNEAMGDLKRVVKGSQKTAAKGNKLDTVSIELVTEDGWQELDVAVLVEAQDEIDRLHIAIAALPPEQQTLIHNIFFQGISQREIARAEGVSEFAIRYRLKEIYAALKISLQ